MPMMIDEWNPTDDELCAWAYEPDAMWPTEDWDLAVTTDDRSALLLRLAMDRGCPSRNFFLRCLYLFVGDAARTAFVAHRRETVVDLLASVPPQCPPDVARWAARSRELINGPVSAVASAVASAADRELWCAGGYSDAERTGG
jgi:hypothetical protein